MPGWAPTRRRNGIDPHREKSLLNNSTPKAWQRTDASLTDPWLAEAWRHTPCSSANPPAELRAAILHGAREAMQSTAEGLPPAVSTVSASPSATAPAPLPALPAPAHLTTVPPPRTRLPRGRLTLAALAAAVVAAAWLMLRH